MAKSSSEYVPTPEEKSELEKAVDSVGTATQNSAVESELGDFAPFRDFSKDDFFRDKMFGENFEPEMIQSTMANFRSMTLDPNDGRFDDIDDEDPMEGVAPYVDEKSSDTKTAESKSSTSSSAGGGAMFGSMDYFSFFDNFPQTFGFSRGYEIEDTSEEKRQIEERSQNIAPKREPTTKKEPEKPKIFAYEKIPGTYRDPPTEKFKQPEKVQTITPSRGSHNPDGFWSGLKYGTDGLGQYRRGYFKKVTPMPHDTPKPPNHTRFVCISDTHSEHRNMTVPDGDVLLHSGDFTDSGKLPEIDEFNVWLGELPHKHKIVIAGNHELSMDMRKMEKVKKAKEQDSYIRFGSFLKHIPEEIWRNWRSRLSNCTYLEDQEVRINGIRIYGSPWQPEFGDLAFNMPRGKQILEKWNKIPGDGIDILMTHGPPVGHGDRIVGGDHVGCVDLLNTVQLRVQPKYHLYGHIHEDYGFTTDQFTTFVNCSSVNYHYELANAAFVFDLPNKPGEEDTFVGPISR